MNLIRSILLGAILTLLANVTYGQVECVDELIVVDSTGKKVGVALNPVGRDTERKPSVALRIRGELILFRVWEDDLAIEQVGPGGLEDILYDSTDCSGPPFIKLSEVRTIREFLPSISVNQAIGPPGRTVYVPDPNDAPRLLRPKSRWYAQGDTCDTSSGELTVVRAMPLANLDDHFSPPFSVVAAEVEAPCCADCNGDGRVAINELVSGVNNALDGCPPP